MDLVSGSSPVGSLLNSVDPQYAYIAGTAFLVFALVAAILLYSFRKQKVDYNSGIFTYLKFIYASFLKPHEKGDGQQDALESFYKTQVRIRSDVIYYSLCSLFADRIGFLGGCLRCHQEASSLW